MMEAIAALETVEHFSTFKLGLIEGVLFLLLQRWPR